MDEPSNFFLVDAFTTKPFSGNPAGVFLCDHDLSSKQMQLIADEVHVSETAFPVPLDGASFQDAGHFHLRWFSPKVEVPLCGHATLSTAHVLFEELGNQSELLRFDTHSGELLIRQEGDFYSMDFPAGISKPIDIDSSVYSAFGIDDKVVDEVLFCEDPNKLLLVMDTEDTVRNLKPDFSALYRVSEQYGAGSIIVTALSSDPEYDFVSRNFAPVRGVNEDPVTGSSHVILGPYWKGRLEKEHLVGYQASSRGGSVIVKVLDDTRVELGGSATTVTKGQMILPVEGSRG